MYREVDHLGTNSMFQKYISLCGGVGGVEVAIPRLSGQVPEDQGLNQLGDFTARWPDGQKL